VSKVGRSKLLKKAAKHLKELKETISALSEDEDEEASSPLDEEEEEEEDEEPTVEKVREKLLAVIEESGNDAALKILGKFKVKKVSKLAEKHYAKCIKACEKHLED
jgi:hypothetical protein